MKARAVELVLHAQSDPATSPGAVRRIAEELGLNSETLRGWVGAHKRASGGTPADTVDLAAENRRLRAELAETKRANEILKKASAFFAAEPGRPSK
ncbi:transposase [Gulosibacter molinativorax]|uniref:transposase n=1 Tax=Gulosibacter molinativorax TaxID=256821 RepID=UPI002240568C|nr:transposase [Gulosibacter molinativorax]